MENIENIPNQDSKYNNISVGFDIVDLPSKGIFYPNKVSKLEVEFMTSQDEDILTAPNLLESGKVFNVLLERKIRNKDIKVSDLYRGDMNAVLLFLRITSYGSDYPVTMIDPKTKQEFETVVDLLKIKPKVIDNDIKPDEKFEFNFFLPVCKKNIKFKLLNNKQDDYVSELADSLQKEYKMQYSPLISTKLKTIIFEIEGERDKMFISNFVDKMPAGDSLALRTYYDKIEPNLDMKYEFTAPSGVKFGGNVALTTRFFWPNS